MLEITGLALLALLGWFVYDTLTAREAAERVARAACTREGLQFLDETVHGVALRLVRDSDGRLVPHRTFRFEFSDDGVGRRGGSVEVTGHVAGAVELEPFRVIHAHGEPHASWPPDPVRGSAVSGGHPGVGARVDDGRAPGGVAPGGSAPGGSATDRGPGAPRTMGSGR